MIRIAIAILVYIISIFLNRWLNKIAYKKAHSDIVVWTWFIPFTAIVLIAGIIKYAEFKDNWFTGKNW
jgi:hypothetical protein